MSKKHYDWDNGPAELKQHSVAKHELLRSYLAEYFPTLVSSPSQDELRLTIVDGFAGGGLYLHESSSELMLGSPFICLQAAEEAEARINANRVKKVAFNVDFVFVEQNPNARLACRTTIRRADFPSGSRSDFWWNQFGLLVPPAATRPTPP